MASVKRSRKSGPVSWKAIDVNSVSFGNIREDPAPEGKSTMSCTVGMFYKVPLYNGKRTITFSLPKDLKVVFDATAEEGDGKTPVTLRLANSFDEQAQKEIDGCVKMLRELSDRAHKHIEDNIATWKKKCKFVSKFKKSDLKYDPESDNNLWRPLGAVRTGERDGEQVTYAPQITAKNKWLADGTSQASFFNAINNTRIEVTRDNINEYVKKGGTFRNTLVTLTGLVYTKKNGFSIRVRLDKAQVLVPEEDDPTDCPWEADDDEFDLDEDQADDEPGTDEDQADDEPVKVDLGDGTGKASEDASDNEEETKPLTVDLDSDDDDNDDDDNDDDE